MIVSSFVDSLNQFTSWLFERQWAGWEIITVAVVVLFVLLWIIRQQRKRAIRNVYKNQFLESTPVIGTKLGARKRHRHIIKNFKKAQHAAAQQGHTNQQKSTKQAESEKLHEQIRQLQREIIKRKRSEVHLEEKVAYLTGVNEKLQSELVEIKQAEKQTEETPADEVQVADEPQKSEVTKSEQTSPDIAEQTAEVSAAEKPAKRKPSIRGRTYEDLHRIVDGVKQKLCRKCNKWKPENGFHKNASSKDGLAGSCKTCKAKAAKKHREQRKAAQD